MAVEIRSKRIYEAPDAADGCRMFVDRLWARGVTKEAAQINVWARQLTPSHELRKWFHANRDQSEEFGRRYRRELESRRGEAVELLRTIESEVLTLVSAVRDVDSGHVRTLTDFLHEVLSGPLE